MTTVAVMQPYMFPYLNYIRLVVGSDYFVVLDDASHSSSNKWVNRNFFLGRDGRRSFTFPIRKFSLGTTYRDLRYVSSLNENPPLARDRIETVLEALVGFTRELENYSMVESILEEMLSMEDRDSVVRSNMRSIQLVLEAARCEQPQYLLSSSLGIEGKGQKRVLEICKYLGATRYINLPGGIGLYDAQEFQKAGVELEFIGKPVRPEEISSSVSSLSVLQSMGKRGFRETL